MKGLLQRLAARAGGRSEGLRPRAPNVFEGGVDPAPDTLLPEVHSLRTSATRAPKEIGQASLADAPQSAAQAAARVETLHPATPPAPRRDARAARATRTAGKVTGSAPRPRSAERAGDRKSTPPAVTMPLSTTPASETHERSLLPDETAPRSVDSRGRAPRPPWSFETAVPRFVPGGSATVAAEARREGRARAPQSPEPVVRVTIERLDVHAVAPSPKPRLARRSDDRPDTLAEYVRKRQEAKR